MLRYTILVAAFLHVAPAVLAQTALTEHTLKLDSPEKSPRATVEDVSWIAGRWWGEALGGVAEETWSKPYGNSMLGMFRVVKDGKVWFCELMSIVEEGGSLNLRLKHFNADMTGWEEKDEVVEFPLVRLGDEVAYFDGLTFRMRKDGNLAVYVTMTKDDGSQDELEFIYQPAP